MGSREVYFESLAVLGISCSPLGPLYLTTWPPETAIMETLCRKEQGSVLVLYQAANTNPVFSQRNALRCLSFLLGGF